jgi:hypothetical protein
MFAILMGTMTINMRDLKAHYNSFLSDTSRIFASLIAIVIFLLSLVVNYFASQYAFVRKGNPATDILLDNLPVVQMDNAFVVGTWIFVLFLICVILARPGRAAFIMKSMALFIVVRSAFIIMTHIGPSPLNTLAAPGEIGRAFSSGADLFFSGHTGMPFLFALMYWHNVRLRYIFIIVSIMAATGVILGHIHYTIDVASAYFITHGIYLVAKRIFPRDYRAFNNLK